MFELLCDNLLWVEFIDDIKQTHQLGLVAGQHLKLSDQVISLAVIQQGQLVDVETVAHLREFLKIINKTIYLPMRTAIT